MADKSKSRERVQVDIAGMIEEIDNYPVSSGIDPDLWTEMTYPQKLRYLLKKQLDTAQQKLDEIDSE